MSKWLPCAEGGLLRSTLERAVRTAVTARRAEALPQYMIPFGHASQKSTDVDSLAQPHGTARMLRLLAHRVALRNPDIQMSDLIVNFQNLALWALLCTVS